MDRTFFGREVPMLKSSLLALSGVYHIKERIFSRLLRANGLNTMSPAQTRILTALWIQDDVPVRQLAQLTSLDKSTLSLSLSRMEQNGVIQRCGDPTDRRVVRVRLTEQGRGYRSSCDQAMTQLTDILYKGIPQTDLDAFLRVLDSIFANISRQEDLGDPD